MTDPTRRTSDRDRKLAGIVILVSDILGVIGLVACFAGGLVLARIIGGK